MSDSGSGNSWTLLSQEENVATLRPLAEGTELHGDSKSQPTEVAITAKTEHPLENQQASEENMSGQFEGEASPSIAQNPSPTTNPTTTPTSDPSPTLIPSIETPPPPPSLVIPAHSLHGSDAHSQSEGLPEGPVESSPDPDTFSDSYTHISSSSPHEPPIPELLGGLELTEEDEDADRPRSKGEGSEQVPSQPGSSVDPQMGEERGPEDRWVKGDAEGRRRTLLASLEQIGRREEEEPEEEFQLPRRNDDSGFSVNKCILGAVILLGLGTIFLSGVFMDLDEDSNYASMDPRDAEQTVKQEWQKPEAPQAAVDEGMDILNKLVKETQQIAALQPKTQEEELNAARGRAAEGPQEQLRRSRKEEEVEVVVEEENVHEAALLHPVKATTAPLGGQEGESRPATGSTEGQTKKPPHFGREGEKTDSRERVKTERKDEEWKKPNHDQQEMNKEVKGRKKKDEGREVKEGHRGDIREPWRERGDGKEWRGKEERNDQKEEKKWKKGKHEKSDSDRVEERKGHDKEKKKEKERGDRKEWVGRNEERNDRKEENQWKRGKEEKEGKKGKDERKDRKEEREWKKGKSEKLDNDREKERRGWEEKKDGTGSKEHGKRTQEKEWKKGKDAYKESGKEWREKKEQKDSKDDKDQRREKQGREERMSREGREGRKPWEGKEEKRHGEGKEEKRPWEGKEERRPWEGKEERRPWEGKEERRPWEGKEERRHGEKRERHDEGKVKREAWKEERKDANGKQHRKINSGQQEDVDHKKQEQHRHNHHREESLWQAPGDGRPTHTRRRPSFGQPDYWVHQRERLRQNGLPSRHCASVEDCARFEGTLPVQLTEFEALLEGYLAKAEQGAGVDASAGEEIRTLAAEFFKDGVFVHDQMSFRDYLEDLADILEDMVDGDDSEQDQEDDDSDLEDEMEMFGKEVMKRFAVERSSEKTSQRTTGKSKKENARARG